MFDKLGKFEASKWYVVIAIWIVVVVIAAPFTSLFFKSVSNQITISIPGSTAQEAQNITSTYFHIGGASSASALLFIQGNVSSYSTFFANFTKYGNASISDFFTIEKGILNSSFYKGLNATRTLSKSLENISSSERSTEVKLNSTMENLTSAYEKLVQLKESALQIEGKFLNVSSLIYNTSKDVESIHEEGVKLNSSFSQLKDNETALNSTVVRINDLEFGTVAEFLTLWGQIFNETHSLSTSNGEAFTEVEGHLNGTASVYFINFDKLWNSTFMGGNPVKVAEKLIPEAVNETFNGTKLGQIAIPLSDMFTLATFQNITMIESFTAIYLNETFHVPLQIAEALLTESPLNVTVETLQEKSDLPYPLVYQAVATDNFTGVATQILEYKANSSTASAFIDAVYHSLNYTPTQFAVSYLSSEAGISQSLVESVLSSNSTALMMEVASQASNESGIPEWFYLSLMERNNVSNLTAYLVSTHLQRLSSLLEKSNLTTKELAEELLSGVNVEMLASELVSNSFSNVSPTIEVNSTLLRSFLYQGIKDNFTPIQLSLMSIESGKYPLEPIGKLRDQLYNGSYLLVIIGGNVTYKETEQVQSYVESHLPSFTGKIYLTGGKPVSHVIGEIGSSAFAIAIPVGIALAIILTGLYFRSVIAAFVPLTVYLAAYVAASDLIYVIVIKVLGITVDFLTPSQVLLLALGLGTDYVVFMASRYIEEREKGLDKKEAVVEMVKWGGKAVTITAFVVALSFLFIYVYNVPFFSDTAIAEMLAVIVIWLTSITLFPSILAVAGDKLFFPRKIKGKKEAEVKGKYSNPTVKAGVVIALVVVSAIVAIGTPLTFNILGLLPPSQATEGINVLSQTLTTSNVFPICVVIPGNFSYQYAYQIYQELSIPGVTAIQSPVSPDGFLVNQSALGSYNYTQFVSHGYMLFVVNQKYPPFSNQAFQVVHQVIEKIGKSGYVGGGPVDSYNILNFVKTDFFTIVALISITMYIILVIITRSFAVGGIILFTILSATAMTLGIERIIFASVGIFAVIPLILVAIIIGIGMDYNIFLAARIHEELDRGEDMEEAVQTAVKRIGTTIAFLGLIFAGTLGSLMLVHAAILQEIGFALAVAAILETTLLWRYLAPSLMILVYKKLKSRPRMIV